MEDEFEIIQIKNLLVDFNNSLGVLNVFVSGGV